MKHDIFIDNNIVSRFANPADLEYKELIRWLMEDQDIEEGQEDNRAYLVVSKKLLVEYYRSCRDSFGATSIHVIISKLTGQNRLVQISNQNIKDFKSKFFTKTIERKLRSNNDDREHIPLVLLSDRKYALTNDHNFKYDLEHFPGFTVIVRSRPEDLNYK
jgi:hypothetical protein